MKLKVMKCPCCGAPLNVGENESKITCLYCGNSIVPVAAEGSDDANASLSNSDTIVKVQGIKTSSSAIAYMEQLFDSYDWDFFCFGDDLYIDELEVLVESLKITSSDDKNTWLFAFESVYYPLKKKIEYFAKLYDQIVYEYINDNSECYSTLDIYNVLLRLIKSNYDNIYERLSKYIKYAEKYGATKEEIKELNDKLSSLANSMAIKSFSDVLDMPEIKAYYDEKNAKIVTDLKEKGIDADAYYDEANELIKKEQHIAALEKLHAISGYKDSLELIKKINKIFTISNIIEICGKLYFLKSNLVENKVYDLYKTENHKICSTPIINNFRKIVCHVADVIYFYSNDCKLKKLELSNNKITVVSNLKFETEKHIYRHDSNVYLLTTSNTLSNNIRELVKLDINTGKADIALQNVYEITLFKDNIMAYKENVNGKTTNYVIDFNTSNKVKISSQNVKINDLFGDIIIYTKKTPNDKNYDLYIKKINSDEAPVLIEKNIYQFKTVSSNKIFYLVGNSQNNRMININFDGTDRTQLSLFISKILFENGGFIYFIRRYGYNSVLCRSRIDGSEYSVIAYDISNDDECTYKNGYFYFVDSYQRFNKVRLNGTNFRRLCTNVNRLLSNQDDKVLYLAKDDSLVIDNNITPTKRDVKSIYSLSYSKSGVSKLVYDVGESKKYDENTVYYMSNDKIDGKNVECLYKIDVKSNIVTKLLELRAPENKQGSLLPLFIILAILVVIIIIATSR